jgi:predicted acyl esterase
MQLQYVHTREPQQVMQMVSYDMDSVHSNHIRYTSEPLLADTECTGYPIANLWISAPGCSNIDVFVYLQMVSDSTTTTGADRTANKTDSSEQRGTYVTEGCFRSEHRCDQLKR